MSPDWAALVRAAQPSIVLPPGDRRAQVDIPGPLALEQVLDLGQGHGVGVVRTADRTRWCVPLVAAEGSARRSAPGDGTAERLVKRIANDDGHASPGFFTVRGFAGHVVSGERAVNVDQTNESVIVGESVVVKWMTCLPEVDQPGSPAADRIATLAEAGFVDMPEPWGFLEAQSSPGHGQLLASAIAYLPDAQDGWDWATADLRALLRGDLTHARAMESAEQIGAIVARMHAALAGGGIRIATAQEVAQWCQDAQDELNDAIAVVTGEEGNRLRGWADRMRVILDQLTDVDGTPVMAIHGDLHVGQVLRTIDPDCYRVTDFDGNPTVTFADRWKLQPAAADVVGMLASLDHVGRIVQYRDRGADLGLIRSWIAGAQRAFMDAYRMQAEALGIGDLLDDRLLLPLRVRQEVREVRYAVQHLPHWVYVPDLALADLFDQDLLRNEEGT